MINGFRVLVLALWVALFHGTQGQASTICAHDVACPLGDRSYHVRPPDNWDGVTPLPVLLHFHGWGRQGSLIVKHGRISGHTKRRGVLLLAPNGRRRSWDFWDSGSADVGFAEAVIEDAARRYPIDRSRIYVSGYSYGAAMAWRYACENGKGVAGLLAVSGTLRQDEECPEHPEHIRHVHGLKDGVLGFPFGPTGETTWPVHLWRERKNCAGGAATDSYFIREFLTFERSAWAECEGGGSVVLDVHPGGHFIPHGWIGWQLDELMGRTPAYP
jgi:polyhydroxybutyrate depolymerase